MSTIDPLSAAVAETNARADATGSKSAGSSAPISHQRDRAEFERQPTPVDGLRAAAVSATAATWGVGQRAGSTLGEFAEHAAARALPIIGDVAGAAFGGAAIVLTSQSPAGNVGEDAPNAAWRKHSPALSDRRPAATAIHPDAGAAQPLVLPAHQRGVREGILTTPGASARGPELSTFPAHGPQIASTTTTPIHRGTQSTTVTPAHQPTAADHVLLAERYDRTQAPTPKAIARAEAIAALPPSHRAVLEGLTLPTSGEVPFRPPKNWDGRAETLRVREGSTKGYKDADGLIWAKGESRTPAEPNEWDVQPSKTGRFPDWVKDAGYVKRDHINVSPTGKVTH